MGAPEAVRDAARDPLDVLELVGGARFVLLGEATHGTHEFYELRAELTKRLIEEHGFRAVAVEADWPDAFRVNRYVRGSSDDATPDEALADFRRFPTWMWRNTVVRDLVGWLRERNDTVDETAKVGFYGLDLYSLNSSIDAVIEYLERVSPEAAERARGRYACFDHAGEAESYAYSAGFGAGPSCEDEALEQLLELQRCAAEYAERDDALSEDEAFHAQQNARLVRNAEEYYRTMFRGRVASWNLRDTHMAETLFALAEHLDRRAERTRIVVWAHNSHLGDARATELGDAGELNLGQVVRERCGADALLVGCSTYSGTVTAASGWGAPGVRKRVRPALEGSYEALLHETDRRSFALPLRAGEAAEALRPRRLERAIGVVYLPETERISHYFGASLPQQFDAVIHVDETRALEPLEYGAEWDTEEAPETYPTGL